MLLFSSFVLQESNHVSHVPGVTCLAPTMGLYDREDPTAAHVYVVASARSIQSEARSKNNPLKVGEPDPRGVAF